MGTVVNCSFTTSNQFNLKQHIGDIHKKILNFKCKVCGYLTSRKHVLQQHISLIHENARPNECGDCHQRFRWKNQLKDHMDIYHTQVGHEIARLAIKGKDCTAKCSKKGRYQSN